MTRIESEMATPPTLPTFHDGRLAGFVLLPDKRCCLFVVTEDNKFYRVVLLGVEWLRADDFREGNIILDLTVQSGNSVQKADVLFALSIDNENRHPSFFSAIMERIYRNELLLVQVDPSYGCVFSCLCTGWLLEPWTIAGEM
jgi:hypothetical protein